MAIRGLLPAAVLAACLAGAVPVTAQVPPPPPGYPPPPPPPVFAVPAPPPASPEAADIAACLCLNRDMARLNAEIGGQRSSFDSGRDELARLDAEMQRERATMDVNNPAAVAHFRELLERRDALFRRSTGAQAGALADTVARYNSRVNEYNARCANRPRNSALLAQVEATLSCPAR